MKKVLFYAFCVVVPGRIVLLGAAAVLKRFALRGPLSALALTLSLAGCAHFRARTDGFVMEGRTSSPEVVMMAQAQADAIQAQAYATRRCAEDSRHCGAMWGPWGGMYGTMDTTQGGVWAPVGATPPMPTGQTAPATQNDKGLLEKIYTGIIQLKESQRLSIKAARIKKGKSK